MTDLCWVPRPFVLNTHAVSAEFHWTCLSCQSLVFAGQCGTKRKTWVNLRTHGTKNIIPNDSTSEQDVFKVPFQTNLCTAAESVRTSKSKPKKTKPLRIAFCFLSSTSARWFPICSNTHGFQATILQGWAVVSNETCPPCRRHVHKPVFANRSAIKVWGT